MTNRDPRIGDIVHYTDESGHGGCYAAIISYVLDPRHDAVRDAINGTHHVHLTTFAALGPRQVINIPYDADGATILRDNTPGSTDTEEWTVPTGDHFTPGTWHHIH